MFLPDYVNKALDILKNNGFEAFVVGGSVRDSLLGKSPDDFDITVQSMPEETKKCFCDFNCIDTGIKHGTVTVIIDKHPLELTTYRTDGEYKDCRHPENVSFTKNLENDLSRRDFTVNAMAYSPEKGVIDLFDGSGDLQNGIIRCVGEPEKRFTEDALRIMRCLRFASVLGFKIEKETEAAAFECKELLKNISAERIFAELKKLLNGKNSEEILIKYRKILEVVIPEIKELGSADFEFFAKKIKKVDSIPEKLTLFLMPLGKAAADNVLKNLKSDLKQQKFTSFMLENFNREFLSAGEVKRFAGKHGIEKLEALLNIRNALDTENEILKNGIAAAKSKNACIKISDLDINGTDLENLGFSGKEIGDILKNLLKSVTDGDTKNKKSDLIKSISALK